MTRGWTGLRDRFAACSGLGAAVLLAFPMVCPVRAQDVPALQILVAEPHYLVLRFRSEDDTVSSRLVPSDLTVTQAGETHDLERLVRFKDQRDVPLNVVVGLGLLRGDARMQRAVRHALRSELIAALDVRRGDQAALMTFAGEVGVPLHLTRDLAGFGGRLTAHAPGTDSMRLRDAIVAGRDLIDQTDPVGISTLILFTDHAADASRIDLWTIQHAAAGSRIPIHLISIGSEEPMPAAIKQLAIESGGSFVRCADDSLAVRRVVRRLAQRLQSLYVASLQQPLDTGTVDVVYRAGQNGFAASSSAGPWSVRAETADAGGPAPLWLVVGILVTLGAALALVVWHTWRQRRDRSSERTAPLAPTRVPEGDAPTLTLEDPV
jgi:Mg-chelatase subunit ChlD